MDQAPGEYRLGEVELREPGPHEVLVEVVASALNHLDLWLRAGQPVPKSFPMVPGCDGAGVVSRAGELVERWKPGDEVVINPSFACGHCQECLSDRSVFCPRFGIMGEHYWGSHGEAVVVGEANLVARPPALAWEEAAAYGLCGLTALRMLRRARLAPGETLLVMGASGGVACAAILLGRRMGAQVFATSRQSAKRLRAVKLGAVDAFAADEKLPIKADVVVDSSGNATWARALAALRPGGRLAICGGTAGSKVELSLPKLFFGQYELIGSTMGTFAEFDQLTGLMTDNLGVVVDSVVPLADFPLALERLESGQQFGKVVLSHR